MTELRISPQAEGRPRRPLALIFMDNPRRMNTLADWWALGWDEARAAGTGVDRWYEIHHPRVWASGMSRRLGEPTRYAGWLTSLKGEKWLCSDALDRVDGAHAFPFEACVAIPGVGEYLASSMAFMLCHAVLEGYGVKGREIVIHGCDFTGMAWQERLFERPNLAYLIGLFRGRGLDIRVPETSTLWELALLDEIADAREIMPGPLQHDGCTLRYHQMYCYGRWVGREPEAAKYTGMVGSHTTLPWKFWPYYGAETLEEVGATPARYARELRREYGMLI